MTQTKHENKCHFEFWKGKQINKTIILYFCSFENVIICIFLHQVHFVFSERNHDLQENAEEARRHETPTSNAKRSVTSKR